MHNQMKTIHHTSYALAVLLLMATALAGCRDSFSDRDLPTPAQTETGAPDGTIEVRLPYAAPLMSTPTTLRAMTPEDECAIDATRSRLFVFDSTDKLLYEAPITSVRPDGTEKGKYDKGTVTAFLKEGDGLKLALYANLDPAQMKTDVAAGKSRTEITKLFNFALSTETPTRLPMWGELDGVKVSHTLATKDANAVQTIRGTIKMLRSVARIDVGLNLSGTPLDEKSSTLTGPIFDAKQGAYVQATYKIKSIRVFNASDRGQVSPLDASYNAGEGRVTALSLPEGVKAATTIPTFTSEKGTGSLLREIYLPETDNPNPDGEISTDKDKKTLPEDEEQHLARPYLILELTNDKEPDKSHYFRLDFLKYSEKVSDDKSIEEQTDAKVTYTYLPLLRNFRYKINITKIGGPGFDSIKDAQKGSAADIQYNVFVISEDDLGEVMYDGKYTLSVTEKEFSVGKYGSQPVYKAQTTWPGGWEIEVPEFIPGTKEKNNLYEPKASDKAGWIDFTTLNGNANVVSPVIQTILPNNTSAPRTGYFYVKAGRMRWLITVHQSDKAQLAISLWSDPEATKPLQYVELHQQSLALQPTEKDKKSDRPVESARGYKRIYVKTVPYIDPDSETFQEYFRPVLERAGRDDIFYFWDYTASGDQAEKSPAESTLVKAYDATTGLPTSRWSKPSAGGEHRYFRYTGNNNVWECIVTVARAGISEDPFEYYTDIYNFSISDGKEEATAELNVTQIEYNAEPSDGYALKSRYASKFYDKKSKTETGDRYKTDFKPRFVMDGGQKHFFIAANTPYRITLISNPSEGVTSFGTDGVYTDEAPEAKGEPISFSVKTDQTQIGGKSLSPKFLVESLDNQFLPYTFTIDLISGIIQPESNCYMIKAGQTKGIFIPVSRVNTAADYYDQLLAKDTHLADFPSGDFSLRRLDEDDDFEPFLVWTDMGRPSNGSLVDAGIDVLERQGSGPEGYVYVRLTPNAKPGSALIAIRSNKIPGKPILWSWHLWVVEDYPKIIHVDKQRLQHDDPLDAPLQRTPPAYVDVMDRLVGAVAPPTEQWHRSPEVYGFLYQYGRKDPFPTWKVVVPTTTWDRGGTRELTTPKPFWDGDGNRFYFEYHVKGDHSNAGLRPDKSTDRAGANAAAGATMSMKEAIAHPQTSVLHKTVWLYENTPFFSKLGNELLKRRTFHYLWNRFTPDQHRDNIDQQIDNFQYYGGKTVFDPSPYGWRIPSYAEALRLLAGYQKNAIRDKDPQLNVPQPSINRDGSYTTANNDLTPSLGSSPERAWDFMSAVAQSRKEFAGFYLDNVEGNFAGWSSGVAGSLGNAVFRRATAISVRPVINQEEPDYTKYLPGYDE